MAKNDGGPAFPYDNLGPYGHSKGMSLRDWFAGQALSAWPVTEYLFTAKDLASRCYAMADAMLAARES